MKCIRRIGERAEFAVVAGVEAVLLIADELGTELQQVPAPLPRQVVGVAEHIVDENLRRRVRAEAADTDADSAVHCDVLEAETGRLLRSARDADDVVAIESENAAGISARTAVEADAAIVGSERVYDRQARRCESSWC